MKKKTIAIHKGTLRDERTGGVNTPVYTSSADDYINRDETFYPRYFNTPNQDAVGKKMEKIISLARDPDLFIKERKSIRPAVSLGGVESTLCSPSTASRAKMSKQERQRIGVTDDTLLRFSTGLEDAQDLKQDLDNALKKGSQCC